MRIASWIQAARPLAQANIAIPLLVGELLAFAVTGVWSWWLFGLTHAAGIADQLFIVFANDVADEDGDRENTTFNAFSGGSRVLAEGKLSASALRRAAALMAIVLVLLAAYPAFALARPLLLPLWVGGIAVLWAYSYPPLRLAYRGYGELAQGLGLGVVLPLVGFYAIAGSFNTFPWAALAPLFVLGVAGNITTALPDEPADKACDKRSWPVRFTGRAARKHSLLLIGVAIAMTFFVLPGAAQSTWASVQALPALVLMINTRGLNQAEATNRSACTRFVFLNGLALNLLLLGWCIALGLGEASF